MKPKHQECGTELNTMRYIEYNKKSGGSKYKDPTSENAECMWCITCKKPVMVEVMHS